MKVRNSFVSNSSASSFILSLKDDGVEELVKCAEENRREQR